jgi:hypothetical protein
VRDPILVHFLGYSKEQMCTILLREHRSDSDRDLFRDFLTLVVDCFYGICRDLNELRRVSLSLYPLYIQPVLQGSVPASNRAQLFKLVRPVFQQQFYGLYLHTQSVAVAPSAARVRLVVCIAHRIAFVCFLFPAP